jgi:hypothetical protein
MQIVLSAMLARVNVLMCIYGPRAMDNDALPRGSQVILKQQELPNGFECRNRDAKLHPYRGREENNPGNDRQWQADAAEAAAVEAHDKETEHCRDEERADAQCPQ